LNEPPNADPNRLIPFACTAATEHTTITVTPALTAQIRTGNAFGTTKARSRERE